MLARAIAVALGGVAVASCSFTGVAGPPTSDEDAAPSVDAPALACTRPGDYQLGSSGALFRFVDVELDWSSAAVACGQDQGRLAVLDSAEKVADADALTTAARTWVGLGYNGDGAWSWIDETPAIMTQPPWAQGRPDSQESQRCGALRDDGRLDDESCADTEASLCECPPSRITSN